MLPRVRAFADAGAETPEGLPDPSTLPGLLRLPPLRLPVKAAKKLKGGLAGLAARVAAHPFGVCAKDTWHAAPPSPDASKPLGLNGLFHETRQAKAQGKLAPGGGYIMPDVRAEGKGARGDRGWFLAVAPPPPHSLASSVSLSPAPPPAQYKHKATLVKLSPLPRTGGGVCAARAWLPVRVVVVCALGSAPPVEHCVRVPHKATRAQLQALVCAQAGVDPAQERLVVQQVDGHSGRAQAGGEPPCWPLRAWLAGAHIPAALAYVPGGYTGALMGDSDEALAQAAPAGTRLQGTMPTLVATRLPGADAPFVAVHLRRLSTKTTVHKRRREARQRGLWPRGERERGGGDT